MGRTIIIVLAVVGLLPLLQDPKALDATTVSGTIVLGLGPPIFALMFVDGYRPLTFHLPFWWCAALKPQNPFLNPSNPTINPKNPLKP